MYSVYQHWDPLKICIVGKSYSPKFYDYIKNKKVRNVFYKIAEETEEDYQKLIHLLESFGVTVMRPEVSDNYLDNLDPSGKISIPPMTPRDISAMIGNDFYIDTRNIEEIWENVKGLEWPDKLPGSFYEMPLWIQDEFRETITTNFVYDFSYFNIIQKLKNHCNIIYNKGMNTATTTRIGKDLYFGTETLDQSTEGLLDKYQLMFPQNRCHIVSTDGHADANFCPVSPGLILSLKLQMFGIDYTSYEKTFPGWEVVYIEDQSWDKVYPFLSLKEKNRGKWWVPGEELNDDFTNFVEKWMNHWVGYVEETVFDVNILVINEKNVVCNNYNQKVFDAFSRHGITPHVVNFRHRYFWDGGLHCITSDIHREGKQKRLLSGKKLMDIYHIWADKEGDISDTEWINHMRSFLDQLVLENKMVSYRITRCKMGFRSIQDLPEWHIMMEFTGMDQLERAFQRVEPLEGELEDKHRSFNKFVAGNIQHALYRDWP